MTSPAALRSSFNPQQFQLRKPPGGYRVFVLGGSSAFGFPWGASVAFCRILGDALRRALPGRTVEAVNAAGMSYGSGRIRLVAEEVLRYDPDLLVVYEANNEFVEEALYRRLERSRGGTGRLVHALDGLRLYALIHRLSAPLRGEARAGTVDAGERQTGDLLGVDVVREEGRDAGEREKERAAGRLEENLRAVAEMARRRGVPVVFCTVGANLRDWAPNQSLFGALDAGGRAEAERLLAEGVARLQSGGAASALVPLERARALAPAHAGIRFQLGRAFEALERWDEAHEAYVAAKDLDAQPARCLSRFNAVLRRLGAEPGARLADAERALENEAPHGLVGFSLIEDYVHPTPLGHWLIARAIWSALQAGGLPGLDGPALAARFETLGIRPPAAPDAAALAGASNEDRVRSGNLLYNQALVLENQGLLDEAIRKNRDCLALTPDNVMARHNLARLLGLTGHVEEAVGEFRRGLAVEPGHLKSLHGLGIALLKLRKPAEAEQAFRAATTADADYAPGWYGLGLALAQQRRLDEAAAAFQTAAAADSTHAASRRELGLILLALDRNSEAVDALRASVAIEPADSRTRSGLADALARQGKTGEAERIYARLVEENPSDLHAQAALRDLRRLSASPPAR